MAHDRPDRVKNPSRRDFLRYTAATGVAAFAAPLAAPDARGAADLEGTFLHPPDSARPWVLWHWMNGHVTREGITLDLEAMRRVGLGGVINFDAGTGIPKGPVQYLGPEWFALKEHAIREAARLGLEFVMHNCPGWSSSGGPWITPERAMQQLTWSETHVEGGGRVEVALPTPFRKLGHYRDVAAIAYPSRRGEAPPRTLLRSVASSSGPVAVEALSTSDLRAVIARPTSGLYAIYPLSGGPYGPGHRTSGLAIGRNGVAVWERGTGKPVFALAAPARLSGWTHVALVYREGVPEVWVGGQLVRRGERRPGDVHPGVGPAYLSDGASYYDGDMTEPVMHTRALGGDEIGTLARSFPGRPGSWDTIVTPVAAGLRLWRNGTYRLTTGAGRSRTFVLARSSYHWER
jgi:hypothetical protein